MRGAWVVLLATTSCIPTTAGYGDVRHDVSRRMKGVDVRWDAHDDAPPVPKSWHTEELTADRAARWAVWRHPAIQSAFADMGVARAELAGALRLPNPEVSASFGFSGDAQDPSVELDITMSLTSLLNLPNRERAGRHRLAAGKAAVVKRAVEVAYAAKRAFVQAVAAEQALALQRSNLAAAVASAEAAAQLLEAGNVARLVLVNEQAMVEELRIAVSDAEANNVMAKQRLAAAIALESGDGMPPLPKALPKMPEEEADMKRLARLAAMGNLDLVRLEAEYAAAASRADAAELAAWLPHLVAGVNLDRGGGAWSAGPVVGMAIPLFDQGQGPIGIAEAQMERADADHRVVAVRVDRAVKSAVTRLAVRRAQVKQFEEKLLPLRDAVLDQTLLQYNAMSLGVFQLLQARRDQIRARTSYIGVMREYWKARLDLEQLARGSLPPDAAMMSSVDVSGPGGGGEDH